MRHVKKGGFFKVKIYCPKVGEERKFSFDPTDFCPVCKNQVSWSRAK